MIRVVDRKRYLIGHQRKELDLVLRICVGLLPANAKASEPAVGRPERKRTERSNAFALKQSGYTRKASFSFEERNDQRLLVFAHPGCHRFFRLDIRIRNTPCRRLKNAKTRLLPGRIVLSAIKHVKLHDALEFAHERLKQF